SIRKRAAAGNDMVAGWVANEGAGCRPAEPLAGGQRCRIAVNPCFVFREASVMCCHWRSVPMKMRDSCMRTSGDLMKLTRFAIRTFAAAVVAAAATGAAQAAEVTLRYTHFWPSN